MDSVTPRVHALAHHIVEVLKEDDSYDAPYLDAADLAAVVIDGRVDLIALAERIYLWVDARV